jgi:hypothetical protein
MKVVGGILGLVTAYAPHNLHSLPDRFQFYVDLDIQFRNLSANVAKMIVGDLNARLGAQLPGEDHIIGPYTFGRREAHQVETPNRDLLLEFCDSSGLMVANTFLQGFPDEKAICMAPGAPCMGPVCEEKFNMLDIFLCDGTVLNRCSDLLSIPEAALGTDQYWAKWFWHLMSRLITGRRWKS